jgi:hypothetical protein
MVKRRVTRQTKELAADFADADFGDVRLTKRLHTLVEALGDSPAGSFPTVLDDSSLEGAYRFFGNESVTPERILAPHVQATVSRVEAEPEVLAIHDTTTVSFSPHGTRQGLGRIREKGQAFFAHCTIAVSPGDERRVHGVLGMMTFVRGRKNPRKKGAASRVRPRGKRSERERWLDQIRAVAGLGIEKKRLVHVMDREADIYDLIAPLVVEGHRFVTRLMHDRVLATETSGDPKKIRAALAHVRVVAQRTVPLSRRPAAGRSPKQRKIHPSRRPRTASLAIGIVEVELQRPPSASKSLPCRLPITIIRVWERTPPAGEQPVEWVLATNLPVTSAAEAVAVVDRYRSRWVIEEFFQAVKTGCALERRQLETYRRIVNALALFAPIAARLLLIRSESRVFPDGPATVAFSAEELTVLRAAIRGRRPLPRTPTIREAAHALAALGGHLTRNGEPGWQTLAKGYKRLADLLDGWRLARRRPPTRRRKM